MRTDTTPAMIAESLLGKYIDGNPVVSDITHVRNEGSAGATFTVTLANGRTYRVRVTDEL